MRLLFVGPPGSGKGTQCEVLSQTLGVPHISTGELLRDAVRDRGITGRRAQHFMSAGRLVLDRLAARGRGDDSKHSVQRRLDIFERVTVPMIAWLAERYPLIKVAAER